MLSRKRILIFVHDGRGLGHMRRLSRIAAELQKEASVLFITGHRDAAHMVPRNCEFIHIPSLDSIDGHRSRHWGRTPFLPDGSTRGRALRNEILSTTLTAFDPDGFISDYLPLGMEYELAPLLTRSERCRKYFIARGILGHPDYVRTHVLTPKARQALKDHYHLILAACDERIVDVATEYSLEKELVDRLVYTGYTVDPIDAERCAQARAARLLPPAATWVVCTAGGGKDGEDLLQRCWDIALQYPECYFDLILGPRSRLSLLRDGWYGGTRIFVAASDPHTLPYRLGGADVVISRGGYNSLMESCVGQARLIVAPILSDYEQVQNAVRLSAFRPMEIVEDLDQLDIALERALQKGPVQHRFADLRIDGIAQTARMILADLAIETTSRPSLAVL
jgi:predicted glycosyltransferase